MTPEQEKQLNGDLNTEAGQRILSAIKLEVRFGKTIIDPDRVHLTYYHCGQQNVANLLDEIMKKDARAYEVQDLEQIKRLQQAEKQQDDYYNGD